MLKMVMFRIAVCLKSKPHNEILLSVCFLPKFVLGLSLFLAFGTLDKFVSGFF